MLMLWIVSCFALVVSALGCGVPDIKPHLRGHSRIFKGQDAVSGSWPWQVSLQQLNGFHFCGGSLINKDWVLTAANCQVSARSHRVVIGEHDFSSSAEPIQIRNIAKVISHPYYNSQNNNNDIALLKLSSPAQLTSRVSPICLASSSLSVVYGTTCVTTGWGRTSYTWVQRILQQTALPLVSPSQCRQYWGSFMIHNGVICAGASGSSFCKGDIGGPLVCQYGGVWTQVGVVSWGKDDCDVHVPGVYARVSYLRSWIDQTMASN